MKNCTNCLQKLDCSMFEKAKDKKDGLSSHCKICRRNYRKQYWEKHKTEMRARALEKYYKNREWYVAYRKQNREKKNIYDRNYYKKNIEKFKSYALFKTTEQAWTLEEKKAIFLKQRGKCANLYCHRDLNSVFSAHADHIHGTNNKRGLLCSNCNVSLGHANDNIKYIQGLIDYLKKYE